VGKATVYCEICGEGIPGDEFAKGRAVHHQDKDYCAKCKHEISHLLPPADDPDGLARKTSRIRTVDPNASSASGVRKSSGIRAQPGIRRTSGQSPAVAATPAHGTPTVRGNGQREHPSQFHGAPARSTSPEKKLYLIGGGALLLVIVVIAAGSWKNSAAEKDKETARADREKAAKEAYENCLSYKNAAPGSFEPLLALIGEKKAAVQGTDWEVQLADLQHKTEEAKKKKETRDDLVTKVDAERLRIGSDPKAAREIKGNLEKYREAAGDDKELQDKISKGIEEARRQAVQADFEEVNQFVLQNPNDYDGAVDKYHTVKEELAEFAQEFQESVMQQIDQRVEWVKQGRETAADGMWKSVMGGADQYRSQHNFAEAKRQAHNFLLNEQFKNCKAMEDAQQYLRDLDREEQAWQEEQKRQQQPPPDPNPPGPGPGPGPGPAAGAKVTLFDGTNRPGMTLGGTAKWEVANGEIQARHNDANLPAESHQIQLTDVLEFHTHVVDKCVLEFEAKIVKGGFAAMLGFRTEAGEPKWTAGPVFQTPDNMKPDQWYKLRLEYDGRNVVYSIDGAGASAAQIANPGKGAPALGIYPGCEVHFRNLTLTEK